MQAAGSAAPKRRLWQRARLLVQGIDAASAAGQAATGFDASRIAPRVQANRQSAVIVGLFKFLVARHLQASEQFDVGPGPREIPGLSIHAAGFEIELNPGPIMRSVMSALPPIADMWSAARDVRFGPEADIA
jgi:hypothetical protein